jgi:predicted O-methyltransferase YrrM
MATAPEATSATEVPGDDVTVTIRAEHIDAEDGHCWMTVLPELASGDTAVNPRASPARLFENGTPLGPAHTSHAEIRARGGGRFSHWGDVLYFSTSDNADPRTGGREYTIRGMRREGEIPLRHTLGGSEVVPSFTGESAIDRALLDEIHRHAESSGKSSWGTRNILHAFILSLRPKAVLEIGAHIGSASVVMAAALKATGSGRLYCVEPNDAYFQLLVDFVGRAGVSDFVTPLQMFSTAPELRSRLPEKIEIIYLDANHSYSNAAHDIALSDQLLAENGLLFLDDVGPVMSPRLDPEGRGGVRQALLDFAKHRPDLHVMFMEPPMWFSPCGLGIVCKQRVGHSPHGLGNLFGWLRS